MNNLVSIYIPTHNRVGMLRRAVDSVLAQSHEHIEVIVCDDASGDGTQEYAGTLSQTDSRVRYLRNEEPRGACAARNLGIMAARGAFITGLDDDDEFSPNRISRFLEVWDDRYSFVCSDFVNRRGGKDTAEYRKGGGFDCSALLRRNVASNQVFTLADRLRSIGGFDVRAKRLQDWDTWLRLSAAFGPFLRDAVLTYVMHHDHENSGARVSRNLKISDAIEELAERNSRLYDAASRKFVHSNVKFLRKSLSLNEAVKTTMSVRTIKPLAWYFAQHFVSRDY